MKRVAGCIAALLLLSACAPAAIDIPEFATLRQRTVPSDHRLLDRHGQVLAERRVDLSRRRLAWTALAEISPALQRAVLAAEDRRFYEHTGVDARAVLRASLARLLGRRAGGASTVSMQVAALIGATAAPSSGRDVGAKLHQMRAAWALERAWSKAQILEAYLNLTPYRGEIEGVAAAAELLYGRRPHALSLAQAIVLASSLRAPNAGAAQLRQRSHHLARQLAGDEVAAMDEAVGQLVGRPLAAPSRPSLAPHVAAKRLDGSRRGDVQTTLDASLQRTANDALRRQLTALAERGVRDGSVLAVDNRTGEVLAYVGSSGALSTARHVDGVRALRQAGSTLKPFVYAAALESRRWTAASLLDDTPLDLALGGGSYRPANYDRRYRGGVALRVALASSLNVPAVRMLAQLDAEDLLSKLRRIGLASLDRPAEVYGPGLALGGADVSLWGLVQAYRVLANGGIARPLRLEAGLPSGEPLGEPVFTAASAFIVADILADREARSSAFGLHSTLETPFHASVKTGTSSDMRDNWCIGFTPRHTVGVWVGNFSGAPMGNVSGVSGAAPIWNEVLSQLEEDQPATPAVAPAGVVRVAGADNLGEWYLAGTEPVHGLTQVAPAAVAIIEPGEGASLALDPGIPPAAQRIRLLATGTDASWSWRLAGAKLGHAEGIFLWQPQAGLHELQLVDPDGVVRDTVHFRVRGLANNEREEQAR